MPEEPKPLLYVVGNKELTQVISLLQLPADIRRFLTWGGKGVEYVSTPDEIPRDVYSQSLPVLFLSSGGLEGYVNRRAEELAKSLESNQEDDPNEIICDE